MMIRKFMEFMDAAKYVCCEPSSASLYCDNNLKLHSHWRIEFSTHCHSQLIEYWHLVKGEISRQNPRVNDRWRKLYHMTWNLPATVFNFLYFSLENYCLQPIDLGISVREGFTYTSRKMQVPATTCDASCVSVNKERGTPTWASMNIWELGVRLEMYTVWN